jgi:hypothetical protein
MNILLNMILELSTRMRSLSAFFHREMASVPVLTASIHLRPEQMVVKNLSEAYAVCVQ